MSVETRVSRAIRETGSWIEFEKNGNNFSVMASIQPVFSSSGDLSDSGGYGTVRRYNFYICAGEVGGKLQQGDSVFEGKKLYLLKRIEPVELSCTVIYYKALADLIKDGDLPD